MSSLEFLFTLLSAVIAGIIGVILLLIGRKSNRRKLYRFGLAVVLTSFIALLVEFQEIREVLIAFAVIAAAIVAAYSMDEARRLRQDNVDRERSDRKERLLNEIIEWASKGISLCALHRIRRKIVMTETKYLRIAELLSLYFKKDAILALAKRSDNRLISPVNKAIKSLKEYLGGERGIGILHLVGEYEGEEITEIDSELVDRFQDTFSKLLRIASEIKAELK